MSSDSGYEANILYTVVGALAVVLNLAEIILICKKWRSSKSYGQLLLSPSARDFIIGLAFLSFGIIRILLTDVEGERIKTVTTSTRIAMAFSFSAANLLGLVRLIASSSVSHKA